MTSNKPNINIVVGQRIRTLRKIMGLSQSEVASKVGFSYQQLQKYEKGESRIALETLEDISNALGTNTDDILESGSHKIESSTLDYLLGKKTAEELSTNPDFLNSSVLQDKKVRASLIKLLQVIDATDIEKVK